MGSKIGVTPTEDDALGRQQALAAALARRPAPPPPPPMSARMRMLIAALRMEPPAPSTTAPVMYGPSGEVLPAPGVAPPRRPGLLPNPKRVPAVQP